MWSFVCGRTLGLLGSIAFSTLLLFVSAAARSRADDQRSPSEAKSHAAIADLETSLVKGDWGETLAGRDFARVPLTKSDAAKARDLLWRENVARITKDCEAEMEKHVLTFEKHEMPFSVKKFGDEPKAGHSLWISMHGGGGAPKQVNDSQWENQKRLYKLEEGIYVCPRAPTDNWNLWHEPHIDVLFDRLIEDMIAIEHIDPDRVYIMGYSAGGDGVYQLAPRMADRWAAAAMMAGHPNDASWLGLRNIGFAIQVGGRDGAYNRNKVAQEWIDRLDNLHSDDPGGYVHFSKVFENKGHWMDGEDAKVLPWMAAIRRNPIPDRVVWKQSSVVHDRLYWLAVPKADKSLAGALVTAERSKQTIEIKTAEKIETLLVRLDDRMLDLDRPIKVTYGGKTLFRGRPLRTIATLLRTLDKRGDPKLMFDAEVEVKLAQEKS